jgi:hypothetical protein
MSELRLIFLIANNDNKTCVPIPKNGERTYRSIPKNGERIYRSRSQERGTDSAFTVDEAQMIRARAPYLKDEVKSNMKYVPFFGNGTFENGER